MNQKEVGRKSDSNQEDALGIDIYRYSAAFLNCSITKKKEKQGIVVAHPYPFNLLTEHTFESQESRGYK